VPPMELGPWAVAWYCIELTPHPTSSGHGTSPPGGRTASRAFRALAEGCSIFVVEDGASFSIFGTELRRHARAPAKFAGGQGRASETRRRRVAEIRGAFDCFDDVEDDKCP
jgi:hypothetical protein